MPRHITLLLLHLHAAHRRAIEHQQSSRLRRGALAGLELSTNDAGNVASSLFPTAGFCRRSAVPAILSFATGFAWHTRLSHLIKPTNGMLRNTAPLCTTVAYTKDLIPCRESSGTAQHLCVPVSANKKVRDTYLLLSRKPRLRLMCTVTRSPRAAMVNCTGPSMR